MRHHAWFGIGMMDVAARPNASRGGGGEQQLLLRAAAALLLLPRTCPPPRTKVRVAKATEALYTSISQAQPLEQRMNTPHTLPSPSPNLSWKEL